jgi:hypothetical protein
VALNSLVAGSCEHVDERSGAVKGGEFLDCLKRILGKRQIVLHKVSH